MDKALNHHLDVLVPDMVDVLLEDVRLVVVLKLDQVLVIEVRTELFIFETF